MTSHIDAYPLALGAEPEAASAAAVTPELALARAVATEQPAELFSPTLGFRPVQSLAANTRRAYRADWAAFIECCALHGHRHLPATPAAIETFIEWRSPEQASLVAQRMYKYVRPGVPRRPASSASVSRALAAIAAIHRWLGFANPVDHASVLATLRINTRGRRTQGHKDPLRWEHIERAMARMGDDLRALRDKALVAVAHSTMLRRAELVALQVSDYRRVAGEAFGRMAVRTTKTEDGEHEKYRHVSAEAATQLAAWLAAANITVGPLFRGITPDWRVKSAPLCAAEVGRTFKVIARLAGIADISRIGAHSTRIGATHDLKLFGADTLDIMQDGGWKSPMMPKRYLQGLESDRGSMARMSLARRAKPRSDGK
jgi:site-specific recombinase XerD